MRQKRFTESKIVQILREADNPSVETKDVCRKHGISQPTFYRWKKSFGTLNATQASELKRLRQENTRMRKLIVDRDLELEVARELLKKTSRGRGAAAS